MDLPTYLHHTCLLGMGTGYRIHDSSGSWLSSPVSIQAGKQRVALLCREAATAAGISGAPLPGMLLLLARLSDFLEAHAVVQVLETLAAIFPGQGTAAGEDQPPAFVAGEVARQALPNL